MFFTVYDLFVLFSVHNEHVRDKSCRATIFRIPHRSHVLFRRRSALRTGSCRSFAGLQVPCSRWRRGGVQIKHGCLPTHLPHSSARSSFHGPAFFAHSRTCDALVITLRCRNVRPFPRTFPRAQPAMQGNARQERRNWTPAMYSTSFALDIRRIISMWVSVFRKRQFFFFASVIAELHDHNVVGLPDRRKRLGRNRCGRRCGGRRRSCGHGKVNPCWACPVGIRFVQPFSRGRASSPTDSPTAREMQVIFPASLV